MKTTGLRIAERTKDGQICKFKSMEKLASKLNYVQDSSKKLSATALRVKYPYSPPIRPVNSLPDKE